jgi:hypothetical protein
MTSQHYEIEYRSYKAHLRILEALTSRDPLKCEEEMRAHLLETWKGIMEAHFGITTNREDWTIKKDAVILKDATQYLL